MNGFGRIKVAILAVGLLGACVERSGSLWQNLEDLDPKSREGKDVSSSVEPEGRNDVPGKPAGCTRMFVGIKYLNFREAPSSSSEVIDELAVGDEVTPLEIRKESCVQSHWMRVRVKLEDGKERQGYVCGGYLSCQKPRGEDAEELSRSPSGSSSPATGGKGTTRNVVTKGIPTKESSFARIAKVGGNAWRPEWNDYIADALEKNAPQLLDNNFVPRGDMSQICPGFFGATRAQKKAVWALLFSGISRYESSFNPSDKYWETFHTWSQGLLQLSYGDSAVEKWRPCALSKSAQNITSPKVNLQCGVSIMRAQLKERGRIFEPVSQRKHAYYWSVLKAKQAKIKAHVAAHIDQLPFCRK